MADGTSGDCDGDGLPSECDFSGPVITEHPLSQEVAEGAKVSFHVAVEGENLVHGVTYCWRKDGVELMDEPKHVGGSTTPDLTIFNVLPTDAGVYDCLVSNPDGCTESDEALLTVLDSCPADLTGDDVVNANDLGLLLGAWGPNPGHPADFTGDGVIDASDLGLLLGAWGPCPT